MIRRLDEIDGLKGNAFKTYVVGAVDSQLGVVTTASGQFQVNSNHALLDLYELWKTPRSNGLAQVLLRFTFGYAALLLKHTGFDQFGESVTGVLDGRVKAVKAMKSNLGGAKGKLTPGDKIAREQGDTEIEYYQEIAENILSTLDSDCALALKRHGDLKKATATLQSRPVASVAATPAAVAAPAAAAGQVPRVARGPPESPSVSQGQFNQLTQQLTAMRRDMQPSGARAGDNNSRNRDNRDNRQTRWEPQTDRGAQGNQGGGGNRPRGGGDNSRVDANGNPRNP